MSCPRRVLIKENGGDPRVISQPPCLKARSPDCGRPKEGMTWGPKLFEKDSINAHTGPACEGITLVLACATF